MQGHRRIRHATDGTVPSLLSSGSRALADICAQCCAVQHEQVRHHDAAWSVTAAVEDASVLHLTAALGAAASHVLHMACSCLARV